LSVSIVVGPIYRIVLQNFEQVLYLFGVEQQIRDARRLWSRGLSDCTRSGRVEGHTEHVCNTGGVSLARLSLVALRVSGADVLQVSRRCPPNGCWGRSSATAVSGSLKLAHGKAGSGPQGPQGQEGATLQSRAVGAMGSGSVPEKVARDLSAP
jgi:hypothetical protein